MVIVVAVILFWDIPSSAKEELKFQVKNVSPQYVLLLKGKSSVQNIGQDMGAMYGKIYDYMGTKTINPVGPPIALYFSAPGPEWEIGVAVPVPAGTGGQGAIEATTLPGGKMVLTMHIGPYEKLNESWNALSDWIKKNKYNPAGPGREVYLHGPSQESDPAKFRTELLWPVM
ncbi:MAG: GyrI-like domain-containing protein [Desulfobacterales bacterium]